MGNGKFLCCMRVGGWKRWKITQSMYDISVSERDISHPLMGIQLLSDAVVAPISPSSSRVSVDRRARRAKF